MVITFNNTKNTAPHPSSPPAKEKLKDLTDIFTIKGISDTFRCFSLSILPVVVYNALETPQKKCLKITVNPAYIDE